jgi:ubiquitin C-terminal hydrolase
MKFEQFISLPIEVPKSDNEYSWFEEPLSLKSCLDMCFGKQLLSDADAWNCPGCQVPRNAENQISLSLLPEILILHLKRFIFKRFCSAKVFRKVDFPIEYFVFISRFFCQSINLLYISGTSTFRLTCQTML